MRLIISIVAGAVALGVVPVAGAQQKTTAPEKLEKESRPRRCVIDDNQVECSLLRAFAVDSVLMKRAAIGVSLSATGSPRDTIGVFVSRVTPKGPAENAGIIEGDRIVSINGVDLRVDAADAGDSYASGLPSRRLTREVQKLAPGATVNLRVWSGGRVRDVRVTAGRASDLREGSFGMLMDGFPGVRVMGDMPRTWIQSFPRIRMERDFPRFRFEEGFPKMHIEELREKQKSKQM
jgi:hypothetical protein